MEAMASLVQQDGLPIVGERHCRVLLRQQHARGVGLASGGDSQLEWDLPCDGRGVRGEGCGVGQIGEALLS